MKKIFFIQVVLLAFSVSVMIGQRLNIQERSPVNVGVELSMIFPSQMLLTFEDTALDSNEVYSYLTSTQPSFRFGGYLRFELFGNHSLESGLYRITRRYNSSVSLLETGQELASNTIRGVAFEIPLLWIISVPLSREARLSTGFGGVVSFFASDFGVLDFEYDLDAVIQSRFLGGIKANLGFEYDAGEIGGFYFGATFQHHFQSIAFMRMEYHFEANQSAIGVLNLNGSYLAAVVRYIFPM
ncbi:MAG: hypothetical protein EA362_03765 [Saprospirales bacterium]|nr:MAG: hypothetical protein EA362_03765 [Saprospirales bacterium]